MKDLKHIQRKNKKVMSFMIIPNSSDRVIQFSISKISLISLLSLVFLFALSSVVFSTGFIQSTKELKESNHKVSLLSLENNQQKEEIQELKSYTEKVDAKLADLNKIENQVLSLVGLQKESSARESEPIFAYSDPLTSISRSKGSSIFSEDYENEMNQLTEIIEEQKEHMQSLIQDIENQLVFLDALPNAMPTEGKITSKFGYRVSPTNSRRKEFHNGIDIANSSGTEIKASGSGVVTYSGYNGSYGRVVIISHGYGYTSVYAHNRKNMVSVGERVEKGQVIALLGSSGRSTGPHLHFEVRLNNEPIDPYEVLVE